MNDTKINLENINKETGATSLDNLIEYWKASLPPLIDYADMVGAPAWAYGNSFVYEDPEGYMIEDTIKELEELKELREKFKKSLDK